MAAPMAFRNKEEALAELVTSEERYVKSLTTFRSGFLEEIHHRDTEERRKLYYGHRAVSVAWELIHILHAHNHQLLKSLQLAGNDVEAVARTFLSFAAAEKAYSVYIANHAEALQGLEKVLGSTLIKYTKDHPVAGGHPVQRYLNLPFERFPQYVEFLQAVQALSHGEASPTLDAAVAVMEEGLKNVTIATDEFRRQNELVQLQADFIGYVDLYAPDRRLVKEGMLTKVYIDGSKRKPVERYTHLLSDALIYSSTLVGPYKYKLAKIHGLGVLGAAMPVAGDRTMFDITKVVVEEGEKGEKGETSTMRFQAESSLMAQEWMDAINEHIRVHKTKVEEGAASHVAPTQPREARVNAVSFLKKHGAHLETLSERSKTILYGIKADLTYIEYLKVFARVLGITLDELSRGIGGVGGKRGTVENGDAERANGLFETKVKTFNQLTQGTLNRVKAANAGKPLQSPELAVFLKVLPVLESLSQALVERLEERLTVHTQTGGELCIGDVYLDMSALFVAYQSYASVMEEAEAVFENPQLAELIEGLSDELAPLTVQQHLTAPMEAAQRMAMQMKAILDMTPSDHSDHQALELATIMMDQTAKGMESNLQDTKDYWKLVEIREAIGSMEFTLSSANPLDTLINSERKLILEGTLLKACRSKDKAYMFWLFTDVLLYATQLVGSHSYQLNRWMKLEEMNVEGNKGDSAGLDILTAEKSFTVFARDPTERDMWLNAIAEAVFKAKEEAGVDTDPAALQVAPILMQTSDSNDCLLCHQAFTLFVRKYHCLSCGNVVCDKCSPSRMILANIHKTQRQRVCNACVAGETHHIRATNTGDHGINPTLAPVAPKKPVHSHTHTPAPVEEEEEEEALVAVVEEEATEQEAPKRAVVPALPFSPGAGFSSSQQQQQQAPSWLTSPQESIASLPAKKSPKPAAVVEPEEEVVVEAAVEEVVVAPAPAPVVEDGWNATQAYGADANPFEGEGDFSAPVFEPAPAPVSAPVSAPVVMPTTTTTAAATVSAWPEPEPEPWALDDIGAGGEVDTDVEDALAQVQAMAASFSVSVPPAFDAARAAPTAGGGAGVGVAVLPLTPTSAKLSSSVTAAAPAVVDATLDPFDI